MGFEQMDMMTGYSSPACMNIWIFDYYEIVGGIELLKVEY